MTAKRPITAYTLTYNEARQLRAVLESIKWADQIIVVDSFSTDGTVEIANEYGAQVISEKFCGFGKLRNFALDAARHDWIFSVDSDERCTPGFQRELFETLQTPECAAYYVPRRNQFLGRSIRYSGWYPDYRQPQVFDRRRFRYCEDLVHEKWTCDGSIGYFKNPILQFPFPDIATVMRKMDRYTSLMAERHFHEGRRAKLRHLALNPPAGFLKKFLLQQGFRDGTHGFMISAIYGYYTFLKYSKLWEMEMKAKTKGDVEDGRGS
jgi:glycosyltransferase involved in cell wall biosynthesis